MPRMTPIATKAKATADRLLELMELIGTKLEPEESAHFLETFNMLTQVVAHHGGPAWNASEEQWEY